MSDTKSNENQFDLEHQYQLYLKRVGLKECNMSPVQKTETKRAFIGACGQILLLLRDDLAVLEEEQAFQTFENLINQAGEFFLKETGQAN